MSFMKLATILVLICLVFGVYPFLPSNAQPRLVNGFDVVNAIDQPDSTGGVFGSSKYLAPMTIVIVIIVLSLLFVRRRRAPKKWHIPEDVML